MEYHDVVPYRYTRRLPCTTFKDSMSLHVLVAMCGTLPHVCVALS